MAAIPYVVLVLITLFVAVALFAIPNAVEYKQLSFDEEVRWLMEDEGLSREEAEEITNLPWGQL